jgi:hypothetical protein
MRVAGTFLALALISVINAAPDDQLPKSVRSLLKRPRTGLARLTWVDGTNTDGTITQVNDRHITFCKPAGAGCDDVDLHKIAEVVWLPKPKFDSRGEDLSGPEGYLVMPLLLSAVGLHYAKEPFVSRFSKLGWWQSVRPQTSGSTSWVKLEKPDYVFRMDAVVKLARYRFEGEKLYVAEITSQGTRGAEEVVLERTEVLALKERVLDPAAGSRRNSPPIVISWMTSDQGGKVIRSFRPDGSCRIETNIHRRSGNFEKIKNGVRVSWASPREVGKEEDWTIRRTEHALFITNNGDTIEYQRVQVID